MGLFVPSLYKQTGVADLIAKAGVTVTGHATPHSLGAWTSLLDPVTFDTYALAIAFLNVGAGNAVATEMLFDVGVGPTGGGSEQVIIPNLDIGAAFTASSSGAASKAWVLPVYIKAGLRLSGRVRALITNDTVLVRAHLLPRPISDYIASRWFSYGESTAASRGTSVTAGSGSFGSWTQIGASNVTAIAHAMWQVGFDLLGDTSATSGVIRVQIGYGPDSSSITTIGSFDYFGPTTTEDLMGPFPSVPAYCNVAASSTLWARIDGTSAEARGVIIYAA